MRTSKHYFKDSFSLRVGIERIDVRHDYCRDGPQGWIGPRREPEQETETPRRQASSQGPLVEGPLVYLGDQRPLDVRDRVADISANEMFGGPTVMDFSMLPTRMLVPRSEKKSLAEWRAQDLAQYYREIHRRDLK